MVDYTLVSLGMLKHATACGAKHALISEEHTFIWISARIAQPGIATISDTQQKQFFSCIEVQLSCYLSKRFFNMRKTADAST